MRRFYNFLLIVLVTMVFLPSQTHAVSVKQIFPKRANYYLAWSLTDAQAKQLAQWDLLILDAEVAQTSHRALQLIRKLNPHITLLAYITSQDIRDDARFIEVTSPLRAQRVTQIPDAWYLKDDQGNRLRAWPGTSLLNISSVAPRVNGFQFTQYLASYVADAILTDRLWDGVYFDNSWERVSDHTNHDAIDINGDGVADTPETVDASWKKGMQMLYAQTRVRAKRDIILVGNGDSGFPELNGIMYENFPHEGWKDTFLAYQKFTSRTKKLFVSVINSNTGNDPDSNAYQLMRYGFTSALLGDGFFSFDDGDAHHERLWWYDEYNVVLGAPRGAASVRSGLWRRDFDKGVVIVNTTDAPVTVDLRNTFAFIRGQQDRIANPGGLTRTVTLPAHDGRILLRRTASLLSRP